MAKLLFISLSSTLLLLNLGSNVQPVQYEYIKQEISPLYGELSCQITFESSLMDCVILSVISKSVSFFFNKYDRACRWDCIFLASRSCTTYCAHPWSYYAIKWNRNAALSRPTTSSSVYIGDSAQWGAHYATDGMIPLKATEIFASGGEISPWITVQLKSSEIITFVRVYNRRDTLGERFHHVALEVSPNEGSDFVQKGYYKGPGLTDQVIEILCDSPTLGRYVRIRIIQGTSNILNIAEVEIYAV